MRALSPDVLVSGQIAPDDLAQLKESGVTLVVNNRPDGESPDQPPGQRIAQAAQEQGVAYAAIPVAGQLTPEQAEQLATLLTQNNGKALLYCRSGMRSAMLWAVAQAGAGVPTSDIAAAVEGAGYSVDPVRGLLDAVARQQQS